MKNFDELKEKYYNAYKNDYDAADELMEATKNDYKQFKLGDKKGEELKVDEETKTFFKKIKN